MTPDAAAQRPVASPCTNVCRIDAASGCCEGCGRSLDEIAGWSQMSDAQKRAVWALLPARQAQRGQPAAPPKRRSDG